MSAGLCTSTQSPLRLPDAVGDVRRGHEQVEVELALEPLAHDLHVQQAEEAAAEAEAERLRRLGLVEERGVVQLQPLERVAQLRVVVRVGREEPGEDHRLDVLVAGQRLGRRPLPRRQRVADAELRDVLEAGDDVADLAASSASTGRRTGDMKPSSSASKRVPSAIARTARRSRSGRRRRGRRRSRRGTGRTRSRRSSARAGASGSPSAAGCDRRSRRAPRRRPGRSWRRCAARARGRRRAGRRPPPRRRPGRPAAGRSCSRPGRSRGRSRSRGRRWPASAPRSPARRRRRAPRPRRPAASATPRR